jgi:uncharacterized membrane protein
MATEDVNYRNRRGGPAKGPSIVLGLVSAGLGSVTVARPTEVARAMGLKPNSNDVMLLRVIGARELISAAGLVMRRRPQRWMWARVAGDVVDIAFLVAAARERTKDSQRVVAVGSALAVITIFDIASALRVRRADAQSGGEKMIRARAAITVNRPRDEVYARWRRFEELPAFMSHVESVTSDGNGRTHWKVKAPAGRSVEWDAEIIADRPGELIAWQSLRGARVPNRGSVRFQAAPGNRGTEVKVDLQYEPPAGAVGSLIARALGEEPVQQMKDDLRHFKQMLEADEIARA